MSSPDAGPRSGTPADQGALLVETAARILAERGPRSLSARTLAREVGTSTMAVYTHFGGMPGLVRAVIREGFARLAGELATVRPGDDPVTDAALLAIAYRRSAHRAPHLYAVMFGGSTIAGFELSEEDRHIGLYAMRVVRDAIPRCIEAGRFRPAEPWSIARRVWCQMHGLVTLELAGYLTAGATGDADFRAYLEDFAIGAGDDVGRAGHSVARAFREAGMPDETQTPHRRPPSTGQDGT